MRPRPDSLDTPHLSASTAGVVFVVKRSIDNDAGWTTVGVVAAARAGKRGVTAFTDTTVPAGSRQVRYSIQPRRTTGGAARARDGDGGLIGPESNVLVVSLGSDHARASTTAAAPPARLAA